jgi:hypothetical protein
MKRFLGPSGPFLCSKKKPIEDLHVIVLKFEGKRLKTEVRGRQATRISYGVHLYGDKLLDLSPISTPTSHPGLLGPIPDLYFTISSIKILIFSLLISLQC